MIEDLVDPIAKPQVSSLSREDKARSGRKKVVVLGSGWGAHALLKCATPFDSISLFYFDSISLFYFIILILFHLV